MLKTISAAFLAASVIAAPAFAAESGKTATQAPVIKSEQGVKADAKTSVKTDAKTGAKLDTKTKAMNANAAIAPSEHKSVHKHRHHHKMLSAKKQPKAQPDVSKPGAPVTTEKRS
ncbi:His-rich protein BRANT [Bradyrhizobium sp. UFLA05-112]